MDPLALFNELITPTAPVKGRTTQKSKLEQSMEAAAQISAQTKAAEAPDPLELAINLVAPGAKPGSPIRGIKSLEKMLAAAEGDDDLLRIAKLLQKRGYDIDSIPALQGILK